MSEIKTEIKYAFDEYITLKFVLNSEKQRKELLIKTIEVLDEKIKLTETKKISVKNSLYKKLTDIVNKVSENKLDPEILTFVKEHINILEAGNDFIKIKGSSD
jgi:hypothetical protein